MDGCIGGIKRRRRLSGVRGLILLYEGGQDAGRIGQVGGARKEADHNSPHFTQRTRYASRESTQCLRSVLLLIRMGISTPSEIF